MRQKRAKTYKRVMALYVQAFNFRTPYQVLVSNDVLALPAAQTLDMHKGFATCVQGEIKPMITQCCMEALYKLGKEGQKVVDLAKTFERRRCNHREAIAPDDCLKDMIGTTNKHRYILSSQSQTLLKALSTVPGLPNIHFNQFGVLVLSPPNDATIRVKNAEEEKRRIEGERILEGVVDGGNVVGSSTGGGSGAGPSRAAAAKVRSRTKGPKAPNPLSMKKKKTAATGVAAKAQASAPTSEAGSSRAAAQAAQGEEAGEVGKKRRRDGGDGDGGAAPTAVGTADGGAAADGEGGADGEKKNKKRKRRGKGAAGAGTAGADAPVAAAI